MADFTAHSLIVLGRQPALGLAELESLLAAGSVEPFGGHAISGLPTERIPFSRLGGTLKLARVLDVLPTRKWPDLVAYLGRQLPKHLRHIDGRLVLGISAVGFGIEAKEVQAAAMSLKKTARQHNYSVRVVPNAAPMLNSAQVLHNKLTSRGGWELIAVTDGRVTVLGQTMFVQDIETYAARDRMRPKRDARVGMLPPKLAQIIINLAAGPAGVDRNIVVLDPFCGGGVLLQEAALIGYRAYGSDIDPKMTEYARLNMEWLSALPAHKRLLSGGQFFKLEVADATAHRWQPQPDIVASEIYLGRPFRSVPDSKTLRQLDRQISSLLAATLKNLHRQLPDHGRLCLAVPAWQRPGGQLTRLSIIDQLKELGYNRLSFQHVKPEDLIYRRPGQLVARELVVLAKLT